MKRVCLLICSVFLFSCAQTVENIVSKNPVVWKITHDTTVEESTSCLADLFEFITFQIYLGTRNEVSMSADKKEGVFVLIAESNDLVFPERYPLAVYEFKDSYVTLKVHDDSWYALPIFGDGRIGSQAVNKEGKNAVLVKSKECMSK